MEVRQERTGWRDAGLSERHRRWGWDCPAIDLDFLVIEYDRGKAAGLIEYKHEAAAIQYASHPSYRAMVDLVRPGIPVFACRYANDFSWFKATPLNEVARQWLATATKMSEREWVTFLYRIRGHNIPAEVLAGLEVEI